MKANGIKRAPYHPLTNELAERFVLAQKSYLRMKARSKDGQSVTTHLSQFLLSYCLSPHATTGVTLSKLFLQWKIRTRLDLLKPDIESFVSSKQSQQKLHHNHHSKYRQFSAGQIVMIKDICSSHQWSLDLIVEKIRPVTYCIELENGKIIRRHVHIRFHGLSTSPVSPPSNNANEMQFNIVIVN